jgi:hypothetical protein
MKVEEFGIKRAITLIDTIGKVTGKTQEMFFERIL